MDNRFIAVASNGSTSKFVKTAEEASEWARKQMVGNPTIESAILCTATAIMERERPTITVTPLPVLIRPEDQPAAAKPPLFKNGGEANHDNL